MSAFRSYLKSVLVQGIKVKYPVAGFKHKHKFKNIIYEYFRSALLLEPIVDESKVKHYLFFLGNQRTGHTLIGSLLDAHECITISHELNALKYFTLRFGKKQVFNLIAENSRNEALMGRGESGYSYQVPNAHQGNSSKLLVIGDKDARRDTKMLLKFPSILDGFRRKGLSIKVIVILRHPFDNIATICRRQHQEEIDRDSIELFFKMADAVHKVIPAFAKEEILLMKQEDFIENPQFRLKDICAFLDVEASNSYLSNATSIVWESKSLSRSKMPWTDEQIELVQDSMRRNPLFDVYPTDFGISRATQ